MQGRKVFAQMKTDYEQGMIVLNKNNIVKTLYREWATRLAPLRPPVDRLLLCIIQTGKYAPAARLGHHGPKVPDYPTCSSMHSGTLSWHRPSARWRMCIACSFISEVPWPLASMSEPMDSEWNITYDEAIQRAQQRRDTISQAAATADTVRRDMTTELDAVLGDTHHYGTGAAP